MKSPYENDKVIKDNTLDGTFSEEPLIEQESVTSEPPVDEVVSETPVKSDTTDKTLEPSNEEEKVEKLYEKNQFADEVANAERAPESLIPPIKEKKVINDDNQDEVIFTLRGTFKSVMSSLEDAKDNLLEEEGRDEWMGKILTGQYQFMLDKDQLVDASTRVGAKWVNMINYGTDEAPLYKGIASDRKGINPRDKNDKSAVGLTKALSVFGLGIPNYIPLYHTGIWLNLGTPTAAAFSRLEEQLVLEKARYGTMTRGEIFSNESVILRKHVVNFILDHVLWTNAPSSDKDYLKSIIKTMDIDHMMLGIMQNRYPEGYPFAQTCTANPNTCSHVVEGLIDLRELSWTDRAMLTDKQLKLMNNPRRVITEEQLKEYQDEFKIAAKTRIVLDKDRGLLMGADDADELVNGIIINMDCPTLEKDEDYGVRWINELVQGAENVFREKHQEEERARRINEEVLVSYFKTYASWIKSIEVYDGGTLLQEINDEDTLTTMFEHLSSDVKYVELFRKLKDEYITKNIVTLVGILNYECPSCGGKHDTSKGKHHIVLPIDTLYTFFTLVRSSVRRSFQSNNT